MEINIKILKKGDKVMNVFPYGQGIAIAIQRKNGEFDVIFVEKDKDGAPRVTEKIVIREGDDVVETHVGPVKVTTI